MDKLFAYFPYHSITSNPCSVEHDLSV